MRNTSMSATSSAGSAPQSMIAVPAAPACGVCSRSVDALRQLADDIVRTIHSQVPTLWPLPLRGGVADRRTSFLVRLFTRLLCGSAGRPGGHQRREPTEQLTAVYAGLDRVVALGMAELTTVLRLLHQVEMALNRWLWDTRWPTPVTELSSATRYIAEVSRDLRTTLVYSQYHRATPKTDRTSLLGEVLVVDGEAASGAANALGFRIDLDTTWCVLVGKPQQARWMPDGSAPGRILVSHRDSVWLLATETARSILPDLHEKLVAAGESLAVVGPVATKPLSAGIAHAKQVARLAYAAGLRGVVRDTDVLLEDTVIRAPEVLASLAGLLQGLDSQGSELRATLEHFYANDLNKTRTATMLGIHRSTLEYRLARVRQVVGLHPHSTRGVQVLATALASTKLIEGHPERFVERTQQTHTSGIDTAARDASGELTVVARLGQAHRVNHRRGPIQASDGGSLAS